LGDDPCIVVNPFEVGAVRWPHILSNEIQFCLLMTLYGVALCIFSRFETNFNFNLTKLVHQHVYGVLGSITWVLLEV